MTTLLILCLMVIVGLFLYIILKPPQVQIEYKDKIVTHVKVIENNDLIQRNRQLEIELQSEKEFYRKRLDDLNSSNQLRDAELKKFYKMACYLKTQYDMLSKEKEEVEKAKKRLEEEASQKNDEIDLVVSQKKSSEVRLGLIAEKLVPILEECPYKPEEMVFIGKPIDYLVFDEENKELIFLEIKTGKSVESKKQRTIKEIIRNKSVYYDLIRIDENRIKYERKL